MSRYCRAFVIAAFYMTDNNGLRTLPENRMVTLRQVLVISKIESCKIPR